MDQNDADRVMSLLAKGTYVMINAEYTVHIDKPDEFIRLTKSFFPSD
jgi:hypothetical protein